MYSIEEQIRQAMAEGKFAGLPGKGQPLHLDENPFADPDWRLAFHVLSSSGFTLPWIENRQEILAEMQAVRLRLSRAWEGVMASQAAGRSAQDIRKIWNDAQQRFRQQAADLNQRIFSYNLQAPSHQLQILPLDIEAEFQGVQQPVSPHQGANE